MIWDEFLRHFRFCDEEDSGLSDEEQERKEPKNRPKHARKRIHQAKKNFLEKFKTASKSYLNSEFRLTLDSINRHIPVNFILKSCIFSAQRTLRKIFKASVCPCDLCGRCRLTLYIFSINKHAHFHAACSIKVSPEYLPAVLYLENPLVLSFGMVFQVEQGTLRNLILQHVRTGYPTA